MGFHGNHAVSHRLNMFKVTTDTNNHNSYMTKHSLPSNFNSCYRINLNLI